MSHPVLWHTWVFGKDDYHVEAMALLLSAAAQASPRTRLLVHTDRPAAYQWLAPLVEVRALPQEEVTEWAGQPAYLPRVKALLIERMAREWPGPTVWLDTDMWAVAPLAPWEAQLDAGRTLMHMRENEIARGVTETERRYRAYFKAHHPRRLPGLHQWNSGVLGLPAGRADLAAAALAMLADMDAKGIPDWTREQMAFSAVVSEGAGPLAMAEGMRHYWGNKRSLWQPLQKRVIFQIAMHRHEPQVIVDWVRALPSSAIPPQRQTWLERKKRSLRKHLGLRAPGE